MNTKHNLIQICLLGVVLLALSTAVQAQFTYVTNNAAITITGYTGTNPVVIIPSTTNGLPVTSIGLNAFPGNTILTSITIPGSVTNIGDGAFADCLKLTAITVDTNNPTYISVNGVLFNQGQTTLIDYPAAIVGTSYAISNSVTSIADYAFDDNSLTNVIIPNSVTSIGVAAFNQSFSLTSLTIPNSVTSIGVSAFNSCDNVTSVTIGTNVASIGELAFAYCSDLTSVTIPASVTNIAYDAFEACTRLTTITVDSNNPAYSSSDGVLFNKSQTTLIEYPAAKVGTSYTISNSVTSIGDDAFLESTLTSIIIPNSVISIGNDAFYYCYLLTSITIPESISSIGSGAFLYCSRLTGVYFQGNAPGPGTDSSVFSGDKNATAYYLPGTSGWSSIFDGLPAVMLNPPTPAGSLQVTITPTTAITNGAQWQVDGGILQPSGATVLGLSVSNHTVSFTTISGWTTPSNQTVSVSANSTATITGVYTVGVQPQFNYTTNADGLTITITGYTGPGGAVTIPTNINGLTVTGIGNGEFSVFSASLTGVTIPNSVTSIASAAFYGCSSLTNVTIPSSVTNIAVGPFAACTALTAITVASGNLFYISVAGVLFDTNQTTLIQYPAGNAGDSYAIPNSVTNIGNSAFDSCRSLTSITIPNSVINIGEAAFQGCTSLASVTLGTNISSLGSAAFNLCTSLISITIPASVTNLASDITWSGVFNECTNLTAITVDTNNPVYSSVDGVLFNKSQTLLMECPGGKAGAYTIPNGVIAIEGAISGGGAFYYCTKLTSITIPNSVTGIGAESFQNCFSLTNVTIGNGVTDVSFYAFQFCTSLKSVYFQGNAPTPTNDPSVFYGDNNATVYYLPGTTGWGTTFDSRPTALWFLPNPLILGNSSNFGVQSNGFGFIISWATNISVVVEAATNLANPVWFPISTNTLTSGSAFFSDPRWTSYSDRFYRLRAP